MPTSAAAASGSSSASAPTPPPADAAAAVVSFREAAKLQLKRMTAHGVDEAVASERLMDELLQGARGGASAATAAAAAAAATASTSSPPPREIGDVIALTGCSRTQAAKTLMLKEEIGLLRRQGHGTATLVELLQKRLRFAPHTRGDENGAAQPCTQPHKKLKAAGAPHEHADLVWPPLPPPPGGLRDAGGALLTPPPARRPKRAPDAAGSAPPKRLKPATLASCEESAKMGAGELAYPPDAYST